MTLVSIIKPAVNGFLFVVLLTGGLFAIATNSSSTANGEQVDDGVVQTTTPSPSLSTVKSTATKSTSKTTSTVKRVTTTPKPVATCIVTINGSRYNVQSLRKTHSGGDIFKCGTDMTKIFQSMHGTNYDLIRKYKI